MGYINIPVVIDYEECYRQFANLPFSSYTDVAEAMNWFSQMHVGSSVNFYFENGRLCLINSKRERISVYGYSIDSLFESIDPKSEGDFGSDWYRAKWKCRDAVQKAIHYFDRQITFRDRDIYDIYLNESLYKSGDFEGWYLGDVRVNDVNDAYFTISLEIRANDLSSPNKDFRKMKWFCEDQLYRLFRNIYDSETQIDSFILPVSLKKEKRLGIVAKMFFDLKGVCGFDDSVDSLSLRREHLIRTKYENTIRSFTPENIWSRILHPSEMPLEHLPSDFSYEFPKEQTWAEVIAAMGIFTVDDDDQDRIIKICRENIECTIRYLSMDQTFRNQILRPLGILVNSNDNAALQSEAYLVLKRLVIAHELGHMVFRRIRKKRTNRENETLANWFACLVSDGFTRQLNALLIPHQGEEYQGFIAIPETVGFKKKLYSQYCRTIEELLREW